MRRAQRFGIAASLLTLMSISSLVAPGCTASRESAACETTTECRDAFGPGFVCQDSGLCELGQIDARCLGQYPTDLLTMPEKYKNYIVLGSLLRAQGKEKARHDAAQLALEAVNQFLEDQEGEYPSLIGTRFGIVQCHHSGSAEEVAELAEYLVETIQTPGIIGPASSLATETAFKRVNIGEDESELRRAFFISPSATSTALTALEETSPGLLWRTAPMDDGQGRLMGEFAVDSGKKFIAIYEETPYGEGLFAELEKAAGDLCENCGFSFRADSADKIPLTRLLTETRTREAIAEAELIFFIGAQEDHLDEMIERLATSDFDGKKLFFSDAAASVDTVNGLPEELTDRIEGTRPKAAEEGEATRFFTAAYEARHDETPLIHSFTAHAYDASWLMLLAALRARLKDDVVSPVGLGTGMQTLSDERWRDLSSDDCPVDLVEGDCPPLTLDASRLPELIRSLRSRGYVDVQGASGPLDYSSINEELENSSSAFEFWHLEQEDEVTIVGGMQP